MSLLMSRKCWNQVRLETIETHEKQWLPYSLAQLSVIRMFQLAVGLIFVVSLDETTNILNQALKVAPAVFSFLLP